MSRLSPESPSPKESGESGDSKHTALEEGGRISKHLAEGPGIIERTGLG